MLETSIEKVNTEVKYKSKDNDVIAKDIVANFDRWDDERKPELEIIKNIEGLLKVENSSAVNVDRYAKNENQFKKITLKDSSIKRILITTIAHTYNSIYKQIGNIISIDLKTNTNKEQTMAFVAMQKQALLDIYRKALPKTEIKAGLYNWVVKGEKITYITWRKDYKIVRRKATFDFMGIEIPTNRWEYRKELKYSGVSIKNIEPEDFVYDLSCDNFEDAFKIKRTYKTYQQIKNNQNYKDFLTKEQLKELKDILSPKSSENENYVDKKDFRIKEGKCEVLIAEGDFEYKGVDGKLEFYPNMRIEIIAGKYVGYFKYNPGLQSSYNICVYEKGESGRGQGILAGIISTSEAITSTLNKINVALGLKIYKHYFIKKGLFVNKQYAIKEGGHTEIKLDENESINSVMKESEMGEGIDLGLRFLEFSKGEMEEQTQKYKMAAGATPRHLATLGERKMVQQGQNVLNSYENDGLIDRDVIPMFEKMGELRANFEDEDEIINYKDKKGEEQNGVMDTEVMQANYTYSIIDSQTSMDKKMNATEFLDQILTKLAPIAAEQGRHLELDEVVNIIGTAYEQEQPNKLLQPVQPMLPEGGMNGLQGANGGNAIPPVNGNAGMAGSQMPLA